MMQGWYNTTEDTNMHVFRHGSCTAREGGIKKLMCTWRGGERERGEKKRLYVGEDLKKALKTRREELGRNSAERVDNDEETIRDKEKDTELELARSLRLLVPDVRR